MFTPSGLRQAGTFSASYADSSILGERQATGLRCSLPGHGHSPMRVTAEREVLRVHGYRFVSARRTSARRADPETRANGGLPSPPQLRMQANGIVRVKERGVHFDFSVFSSLAFACSSSWTSSRCLIV